MRKKDESCKGKNSRKVFCHFYSIFVEVKIKFDKKKTAMTKKLASLRMQKSNSISRFDFPYPQNNNSILCLFSTFNPNYYFESAK